MFQNQLCSTEKGPLFTRWTSRFTINISFDFSIFSIESGPCPDGVEVEGEGYTASTAAVFEVN